jgi:hypothetical protein
LNLKFIYDRIFKQNNQNRTFLFVLVVALLKKKFDCNTFDFPISIIHKQNMPNKKKARKLARQVKQTEQQTEQQTELQQHAWLTAAEDLVGSGEQVQQTDQPVRCVDFIDEFDEQRKRFLEKGTIGFWVRCKDKDGRWMRAVHEHANWYNPQLREFRRAYREGSCFFSKPPNGSCFKWNVGTFGTCYNPNCEQHCQLEQLAQTKLYCLRMASPSQDSTPFAFVAPGTADTITDYLWFKSKKNMEAVYKYICHDPATKYKPNRKKARKLARQVKQTEQVQQTDQKPE